MAIDPNEICGWVGHCTNIPHLEALWEHVSARLKELGAPRAIPGKAPPVAQDAAETQYRANARQNARRPQAGRGGP